MITSGYRVYPGCSALSGWCQRRLVTAAHSAGCGDAVLFWTCRAGTHVLNDWKASPTALSLRFLHLHPLRCHQTVSDVQNIMENLSKLHNTRFHTQHSYAGGLEARKERQSKNRLCCACDFLKQTESRQYKPTIKYHMRKSCLFNQPGGVELLPFFLRSIGCDSALSMGPVVLASTSTSPSIPSPSAPLILFLVSCMIHKQVSLNGLQYLSDGHAYNFRGVAALAMDRGYRRPALATM